MRYTTLITASALLCAGFFALISLTPISGHEKNSGDRVHVNKRGVINAAHALSVEPLWVGDDDLRARILVDNENPTMAAIAVRLKQGWHTYWHTPGDAGLAPQFTWNNAVNMAGADVLWPAPRRFDESGFATFGYADSIVFPLRLRAQNKNAPVRGDLKIDMMICKDICIPKTVTLSLDTKQVVSINSGDKKILQQAFNTALERGNTAQNTNNTYTLRNVQIFDDHLQASVTILPKYSAAGRMTFPLQSDIDAMDIFAVVYDAPDAPIDAGTPLMGTITKTLNEQFNSYGAVFKLRNTPDITDLNTYTRGKTVHVVITHKDGALTRDIRIPAQKSNTRENLRERVKKSRAKQH